MWPSALSTGGAFHRRPPLVTKQRRPQIRRRALSTYLAAPTRSGVLCRRNCLASTLRRFPKSAKHPLCPAALTRCVALCRRPRFCLTRAAPPKRKGVQCPLERTQSATALHVNQVTRPIFSLTAPLPGAHPGAPPKRSDATIYSTFLHVRRRPYPIGTLIA